MTDIKAVKAFIDWQEERRLEGKPFSVEAYEEWLRVTDLEDRIRSIQAILEDTAVGADEALDLIGALLPFGLLDTAA